MQGKTIKQISDELRVSKQAIWQRVKRSEELSAMLGDHSETVNGTVYVDEALEQRIKEQYSERSTTQTIDDTSLNIDETIVNNSEIIDGSSSNIDVNTLIATLQDAVDTLQQQLTVKDKQIDELTAMLNASQERQKTLITALSASQALHAGTIKERLTERSDKPQKGFFSKIFRTR